MRFHLSFLIAPLALAACQGGMPDPATPMPAGSDLASCGADALQSFVGAPVGAAQQAAGQSITRVYAEGDPVTMDFLPERLNIVTDGRGTVMRIACG